MNDRQKLLVYLETHNSSRPYESEWECSLRHIRHFGLDEGLPNRFKELKDIDVDVIEIYDRLVREGQIKRRVF
jgi:hypothetical protein